MESVVHTPVKPVSDRRVLPAWRLVFQAIGGPRQWPGKIWRMASSFYLLLNYPESNRRLRKFQELGYTDELPSQAQLTIGSMDMLRYFIVPSAADFYQSVGIGFGFHQVLRILDDPASVMDPIGIRTSKQGIINHLLQVVHTSVLYDLQLLRMWPDGLDEMERQTAAMIDGTHVSYKTISAVNEEPAYFVRMLDYIRRYKVSLDENEPFERRSGVNNFTFKFLLMEYQFRSVPGFLRYAHRLPKDWKSLRKHYKHQTEPDYRLFDEAYIRKAASEAHEHGHEVPPEYRHLITESVPL